MKYLNFIGLLHCVVFFMFSCNTKNNDEHDENSALLIQAYAIHEQSLDLREDIMKIEKELDSSIDFAALKLDLKVWDKDIIEVPGFEHAHDDEHQRAYHVHNPIKNQTDEQHLQYQQMMFDEIKVLHQRFLDLKNGIIQ
jgi:hypothetical protein